MKTSLAWMSVISSRPGPVFANLCGVSGGTTMICPPCPTSCRSPTVNSACPERIRNVSVYGCLCSRGPAPSTSVSTMMNETCEPWARPSNSVSRSEPVTMSMTSMLFPPLWRSRAGWYAGSACREGADEFGPGVRDQLGHRLRAPHGSEPDLPALTDLEGVHGRPRQRVVRVVRAEVVRAGVARDDQITWLQQRQRTFAGEPSSGEAQRPGDVLRHRRTGFRRTGTVEGQDSQRPVAGLQHGTRGDVRTGMCDGYVASGRDFRVLDRAREEAVLRQERPAEFGDQVVLFQAWHPFTQDGHVVGVGRPGVVGGE